jgi:hemoglobin
MAAGPLQSLQITTLHFVNQGRNIGMRKSLATFMLAGLLAAGSLNATLSYAQEMSGKATMKKPLYDRLGGKKAITAVVDEFVNIVAADSRINKFFAKTASDKKLLTTFKSNLVDQICQGTGGPCRYKGKDMKSAHAGMGVSDADFGALVEDLIAALNKFNVPETEKNELLSALAPMKGDIVEK